jgi:hypothetical protein
MESMGHELAVVTFSELKPLLKAYPRIRTSKPQVGEKVALVAFGRTYQVEEFISSYGTKRLGYNRISSVNEDLGIFQVRGWADTPNFMRLFDHPTGQYAAAAPGDSGGAVFSMQRDLIGVINGGFPVYKIPGNLRVDATMVDLSSEESRQFLEEARAEIGAHFTYR